VVSVRNEYESGVTVELLHCCRQAVDGIFEVEVIRFADDDGDLAGELGADGCPLAFDDVTDVIAPPRLYGFRVSFTCLAVKDESWRSICCSRTENRLE